MTPLEIDRNWFITVAAYGTWLPGDERGFVSYHRPQRAERVIHNAPGTPRDANLPDLERYCSGIMKGDPVSLNRDQAFALWAQFQETANYRRWQLWAVAIMANHFHTVVGVPGDPEPGKIRGDLKSYSSRSLNRRWGQPKNGTWWADGGSNRILPSADSLFRAIRYVIHQEFPLLIWTAPIPELNLAGGIVYPRAALATR